MLRTIQQQFKEEKIRDVFGKLSTEELETIIGNHIPNSVARTTVKLCKKGVTQLFRLRYRSVDLNSEEIADGFYYELNPTYIPTLNEYRIAGNLLHKEDTVLH